MCRTYIRVKYAVTAGRYISAYVVKEVGFVEIDCLVFNRKQNSLDLPSWSECWNVCKWLKSDLLAENFQTITPKLHNVTVSWELF